MNWTLKTLGVSVLVRITLFCIYGWEKPDHFEKGLLIADIQKKSEIFAHARLERASLEHLYLLDRFGELAFMAGERYPIKAVTLYGLYGETTEFNAIIKKCGYEDVIPVVWEYFQNEHLSVALKSWITDAFSRLRTGTRPLLSTFQPPDPIDRGWYAIKRMSGKDGKGNCHEFLAQFAIKDGTAERIWSKEAFGLVESFLARGLIDLETNYRLREKISAADVGFALVDIVALGLISTSVLKLIPASKILTVAKSAKLVKFLPRARMIAPAIFRSRLAWYGTIAGVSYLAIKHPRTFSAGVSTIAESVGLSGVLLNLIVWFCIAVLLTYPIAGGIRIYQIFCKPLIRKFSPHKTVEAR